MKLWIMRARIAQAFRRTVTASVCGHETKVKGLMATPFGAISVYRIPARPEYCLSCLGRMAVQCICCEKPIWVGDSVTLYQPNQKDKLPRYAFRLYKGSDYYVACTRLDCAKNRKSILAHWLPPGKVVSDSPPTETVLSTRVAVSVSELNNYPRYPEDDLMLATEMQREEG